METMNGMEKIAAQVPHSCKYVKFLSNESRFVVIGDSVSNSCLSLVDIDDDFNIEITTTDFPSVQIYSVILSTNASNSQVGLFLSMKCCGENTLGYFSFSDCKISRLDDIRSFSALAINTSGTLLAIGDMNGIISVRSIVNNEEVSRFQASSCGISGLAFDRHNNLISTSNDLGGQIYLWEGQITDSNPCLQYSNLASFRCYNEEYVRVLIHPVEDLIVAASTSGLVTFWDINQSQAFHLQIPCAGSVTDLCFHSEDFNMLYVTTSQGYLCSFKIPPLSSSCYHPLYHPIITAQCSTVLSHIDRDECISIAQELLISCELISAGGLTSLDCLQGHLPSSRLQVVSTHPLSMTTSSSPSFSTSSSNISKSTAYSSNLILSKCFASYILCGGAMGDVYRIVV